MSAGVAALEQPEAAVLMEQLQAVEYTLEQQVRQRGQQMAMLIVPARLQELVPVTWVVARG